MIACSQWASVIGSISLLWAIVAVYAIWRFTGGGPRG